jgi:NitT/TauT family transport system substrate-binding protein
MPTYAALLSLLVGACVVGSAEAREVRQVRFACQLGLGYLQFCVMQDLKLVEKHARATGLGEITTEWAPVATPTALTDALLTGNSDALGLGPPPLLTL